MKKLTTILISIILFASCSENKTTTEERTDTIKKKSEINVPDSLYKITSEKENVNPKFGFNKCNIEVELKKKISKDELTFIANKIRETRKSYDKLWIFYNLPEMTSSSGAWATTHFTPNLEVEILGTTSETEKKMASGKVDGTLIGKWEDARPYANCLMTLYKKNNKIFMKRTFSDGSSGDDEYIKKFYKGKTRYELKKNPDNVYYLVEKNGNLTMWGNDGKFGDAIKKE